MDTEIKPKRTSNKKVLGIVVVVVVVIVIVASLAYVELRPSKTLTSGQKLTQSQETLSMTWANVPNLDPAVGEDEASLTALANIYDSLVFPTPTGGVAPDLAISWTISPNGLVYTFNLRPSVLFHNGNTVTAQDVVFSMERLLAMGQGLSYLFAPYIANVSAPSNSTVIFTLKAPYGPFLDSLVFLYVLDKNVVVAHETTGPYGTNGDYGDKWLLTHDAGSGPYEVIAANLEANVTLEEFSKYWNGTKPNQPKYVNMIGSDQTSTVEALFDSKQIQVTDMWQTYSTISTLSAQPGASMLKIPIQEEMYLMMNTQKAPTDSLKIREALTYALDYNAIIGPGGPFQGMALATGPINDALPGADTSFPPEHQNLTLAKELVSESRYAGNISKYPITYMYTTAVPAEEQLATLFAANAAQIGITVNIVGVPWLTMEADMGSFSSSPNIASVEVAATYPEAGSILSEMYTSPARGTYTQNFWFNNSTQAMFDREIANATAITNQTSRFAAYYQIQQQIYDMYTSIYAFNTVEIRAYYPNIVDFNLSSVIPILGYIFYYRNIGFNATAMPS
ncbi:MAG: ABC transporter substrate-binding protein [Candidatus Parvarchaeota archaeon]